jgi:hypothetical protein
VNDVERKVLQSLSEAGWGEDWYLPFAPICDEWGLARNVVRRACRSLARKGLAEFESGLWDEDGEPAGSGYTATEAGRKAFAKLKEKTHV